MTETELRMYALDKAIQHPSTSQCDAEGVVRAAEQFYEFLTKRDIPEQGSTPPVHVSDCVININKP